MILDAAQRAYIKNGSIHQCLQTVVSAFEDSMESGERIFCASYDVRKAFDSVQTYSLIAACERLNMPDTFIKYVVKTLDGARSAVYTHDGPTGTFDLLSGVRQGDPLSAILFGIMMDALHAGFRHNPLFDDAKLGYTFSRGKRPELADARVRKKRRRNKLTKVEMREVSRGLLTPPTVASAGFADDTITITNSWENMQRQHLWLVDFFVAHHIMLNGKKSVLVSSEAEGMATSELSLPDIDWTTVRESGGFTVRNSGELPCKPKRHDIPVRGRDTEFRYLGLYVSLSLKWTRMVNALHFHVINAARRIRAHRLTLTQAIETLREYIFPKMELALTYARVTEKRMENWDKIIMRAVTWQWNGFHVSTLSRDALYFSTDLMRICDLRRLI